MSKQAVYSQQMASYQMANTNVQKTRQLVMLYDAVIRHLKQAKLAMEENRFQDRFNLLTKAGNIISGLHGAIDFEKGGAIAEMLNSYYFAIDMRIIDLNRSNSGEACEQIIEEIKMMRDAWEKIDIELSLPIGMPKTTEDPATGEKINADFSA